MNQVPKKKSSNHYIDNKKFYTEMVKFHRACEEAKAEGIETPRIPNYVGECIMMIAKRLATRPNFVGYSYKDEMISDGIENCLTYIHNFNPEKSTNPFAYFTQIIYYAFLRRIQKEKKQTYIKHKNMQNSFVIDDLASEFGLTNGADEKSDDVIRDFEEKAEANRKKKKKAAKKKGIEVFT